MTLENLKSLIKTKGEDDGVSSLVYFNDKFNKFIDGLDLVAAYLNKETGSLCFSLMNQNDVIQDYVSWYYFDNKQREQIANYVLSY